MSNVAHHHRSTLKQKNKPFKSKFSSKRKRSSREKGRLSTVTRSDAKDRFHSKTERQVRRLNLCRDHLLKVRDEGKLYRGSNGIPKVVSIIGLTPDSDTKLVLKDLCEVLNVEYDSDSTLPLVWDERQHQRYRVIPVDRDLRNVADSCLFSDIVLLVLSAVEEVDATGDLCLSLVKAMGTTIRAGIVQRMESVKENDRNGVFGSLRYYLRENFGEVLEIFDTSDRSKFSKISRWIGAKTPQQSNARGLRSYIVPNTYRLLRSEAAADKYTLVMEGHVRGGPMCVDSAVYVPDVGTFLLEKIEEHKGQKGADSNCTKEHFPPENRAGIISYFGPDPMDANQPLPTDKEVDPAQRLAKKVVKAPKGTSSYQAAWLVESDGENDGGSEGDIFDPEEAEGDAMDIDEDKENTECNEVSEQSLSIDDRGDSMSIGTDDGDGREDWSNYLEVAAQKKKEELEEKEFPDEIELHPKVLARERLKKYRGLKNLKTSLWDKYDNLPIDYSKISHVKNAKRSYELAVKSAFNSEIQVGTQVSVFIKDVPCDAVRLFSTAKPPVCISLYKNEEKFTLANFSLIRRRSYSGAIKSKDQMVIQYGFRRLIAGPIYSTNTKGGRNNVHKFEKFLHEGVPSMATMYAPISFGSVPIVMYRSDHGSVPFAADSGTQIVATGTLENMDTSRIIVKRAILTGHPFKVNRRTAIIRYMFFNPEDVNYFKPLQLRSKLGLRGHITQSVGTHGRMKCSFDKQIKSNDTVCIHLYKRVFPKWTSRSYTPMDWYNIILSCAATDYESVGVRANLTIFPKDGGWAEKSQN